MMRGVCTGYMESLGANSQGTNSHDRAEDAASVYGYIGALRVNREGTSGRAPGPAGGVDAAGVGRLAPAAQNVHDAILGRGEHGVGERGDDLAGRGRARQLPGHHIVLLVEPCR